MGNGEIVVYQPDEITRLEVKVERETVWLTQEQIAALFGVKRPAITKQSAIFLERRNWKKSQYVPFWNELHQMVRCILFFTHHLNL